MDKLIKSIQSITFKESNVDELIKSIEKITMLGKRKREIEYQELKSNYSKLVKINKFLESINNSEKKILKNELEEFLTYLDRKTMVYLTEINWEIGDPDIISEYQNIAYLFGSSLNLNDPYQKLSIILEAYSKIINIIDDFGNDK